MCKCGIAERARCLVVATLIVVLVLKYMGLDESKKRYIKHLARQVPYLPARYFV